jgi:FkbM family methyltransferase
MTFVLFLKNICPPFIWRIIKKFKKVNKYSGLNNLDKKLEKYLNFDNGFYVELGANNGIEQSNTLYYELYRGWTGILVEPILHKYLDCKKNRSPRNIFFNNACVSFGFTGNYVKLLYSNLMTVPTNLESDLENFSAHANYSNTVRAKKQKEEVVEFYAKPKTIDTILISSNAPKMIDLLSIDVEGAEIEVLKGIKFENYSFKFILVESRDEKKILSFLSKYKYKLIDQLTHHDFLFKRID